MSIEALTRSKELSYYFKIMGLLAAAKASTDLEGIADCIADLEMIAMHFDSARICRNAGAQAERASEILADMQTLRFPNVGPIVDLSRVGVPANLDH